MAGRGTSAVRLDGSSLTLEQVGLVAAGAPCRLDDGARRRVRASRAVVERAVAGGGQIYGVNTGF
ncbi:MAG TPA: aromatic amino acid lyase, partial [Candidatus Polarisedimenticolaceae bacterium]|nr:aromatic amino acid lyase [Candidatus Polarisedimenticolaceae bacterium]